jgi:hypothetical protein
MDDEVIELVMVTKGVYDEEVALAVFEDGDDAALFAEDWNLRHLHDIQVDGDEARPAGPVRFYPAGTWHRQS